MAEFNKLIDNFEYEEFQEVTFYNEVIKVKQYLPIKDKLDLIQNVVNLCDDKAGIYNPGKIDLFLNIEILFKYTDIDFGEISIEQYPDIYDKCLQTGLLSCVTHSIPSAEIDTLYHYSREIIHGIHEYSTSVYGMLDIITTEYKNLDLDADEIRKKLADPESFPFLKEVLDKLG